MRAAVKVRITVALIVLILLASRSPADDWPTWRYDVSRSAASPQTLPDELHLQWTRHLDPLKPAWEEDPRIHFDAHYEPIVMGKSLFVASSLRDTVTAYSTETGKEQWRFFANGPIRFAPVAQDGKLWVGSDDGHVYCLNAKDGSLIWKYNAVPSRRKVLGNERLIPVWPVRGGLVLDQSPLTPDPSPPRGEGSRRTLTPDPSPPRGEGSQGRLHFTIGVWPFEGTFLCTLDAATGKLVSKEQGLDAIHALTDQAPQGYLALAKNRLFIPSGRGPAYCIDRTSGKRVTNRCDSRGLSDYHVQARGPWIFHGERIYNVDKEVMMTKRAARPVVTDAAVYGTTKDKVVAYDLKKLGAKTVKDRKGRPMRVSVLNDLWSLTAAKIDKTASTEPLRIDLLADKTLYGHRGNLIFALRMPTGDKPASVVWKQQIKGSVATMITADDRLFVVTKEGSILCFGADKADKPATFERLKITYTKADDGVAEKAKTILQRTGQTEGYCLVFVMKDGRLTEELARQSKLQIIAFDPDKQDVDELRRKFHKAGLYGKRVVVYHGNPLVDALPPYLANLIVCEEPALLPGFADNLVLEKAFHSLRPYGGMAVFEMNKPKADRIADRVEALSLPKAKVEHKDNLLALIRPGALPGSGDWTHEYGDAQNTLSSSDKLVKAPLGLLWFGGPASSGKLFYDRHDWGPSMAVFDGRMFLQGPEIFTAVDVYTGRILWQRKMPKRKSLGRRGNFTNTGFHYVALKDSIYLNDRDVILRMDPRTGKTMTSFAPPKGTVGWGRFRVWRDQLLITVFTKEKIDAKKTMDLPTALMAINRFTGDVTWSVKAERSFQLFSIGKNNVFAMDATMPDLYASWKRKGRVPKALEGKNVIAYNLQTGKQVWKQSSEQVVSWLSSSSDHGVVLTSNKESIVARRARDGALLWERKNEGKGFKGHPESVWDKVIILGDKILDQRGPGLAYELKTGDPVLRRNPLSGKLEPWQFTKAGHHCNYAIANEHIMTFRAASAGFCDLDSANTSRLGGFRSGCRNSLIPANGVLNAPNMAHGCVCSYNLFTSLALVHVPEAEQWAYSTLKAPAAGLQRVGINFGAPGDRLSADGTLWLDHPNVGGSSPAVSVKVTGEKLRHFHRLAEEMEGDGLRWVGSSGVEGVESVTLTLASKATKPRNCSIKLYFAEWDKTKVGERIFDVHLGDKVVLKDLDVFKEGKGPRRVLVKELRDVEVTGALTLTFKAKAGRTTLAGIEVITTVE